MWKNVTTLTISLILIFSWVECPAVETAERISDREIIESLATLKEGQRNINQRFVDVNQRFEDMNQRFEDLREDMNQRFEGLQNTILVLFGAIITLIVALFGYIAWERRTTLKPLQERLDNLEIDLRRDLDIQHEEGSRITRLVKALRELAKTDKKVAEVLRSFSLM